MAHVISSLPCLRGRSAGSEVAEQVRLKFVSQAGALHRALSSAFKSWVPPGCQVYSVNFLRRTGAFASALACAYVEARPDPDGLPLMVTLETPEPWLQIPSTVLRHVFGVPVSLLSYPDPFSFEAFSGAET